MVKTPSCMAKTAALKTRAVTKVAVDACVAFSMSDLTDMRCRERVTKGSETYMAEDQCRNRD